MTLLAGRAVVVTGAGQGLGRAYALHAAAAGASVVVNDVDGGAAHGTVHEIRAAGGFGTAVVGSVGDWGIAASTVETCVTEYGRIDGFVANAAIMHTAPPWEETEAGLRRMAEVNILGVQFGVAHAMRAMIASGRGGSIVTVVSGSRLGIPGMSAYGASKGAVAGMTVNWALEGAAHGIRVNAISPLGATRMAAMDARADAPEFPDPAAVAPLVTALLSGATERITGRIIRFTGTLLATYADPALEHEEDRTAWNSDEVATTLGAWFRSGS